MSIPCLFLSDLVHSVTVGTQFQSALGGCNNVGTLFPTVAPVTFVKALRSLQLQEGGTAHLSCEVSKSDVPVEWKKGTSASDKYEIRQEGTRVELFIYDAEAEDAGDYTCDLGDQQTTASLQVKGRRSLA
uniref:Ig-like domain-containing protein n=1 Tax=Athene cunicularia TaxID=194338 RepID=A0A663M3I8_ATHCN